MAAGEVACQFTGPEAQRWDKPDGAGPVTEADLAVNRLLEDRLQAARPDYGWLSEESEDGTERLSRERVFVVDPIDGTRSFAEGSQTWAHSDCCGRKRQRQWLRWCICHNGTFCSPQAVAPGPP